MSFYDLSAKTPTGEEIKMSDFKDKAVLIVNTATKCGFTPQFTGLEILHQEYKHQGLVVLGFPCNQFASQEPLSNEDMVSACQMNHGVTFQLTEKIDVNGKNEHPVFEYLKGELGGFLGKKVKWNFTKFLVTPEGKPFKRYASITKPKDIEADVKQVLKIA